MANAPSSKTEVIGIEQLPKDGVFVIPNQLSFQDLLHLEQCLDERKITFLIDRHGEYDPLLQAHLNREEVSAFEFERGEDHQEPFRKELTERVSKGEAIVFVPSHAHVCAGQLTRVPSAVLKFLLSGGAPVTPLFVDHPEETRLSIESRSHTECMVFAFGKPLEREAANLANYRESLLAVGEEVFSRRPILKMSLPYALLKGLKKHGGATKVIDGNDGEEVRFDRLLAGAIAFSEYIKKATDQPRVGIVLPPGRAGVVANLAVLLAGKIPVNLNFTAGDKAVTSSIAQAGLDRFITADPFVRKMTRFNWPPNKQLIYIERTLPTLKKRATRWFVLSKLLPARLLAMLLGVPTKGGDKEAVLLFTSGSAGDPKGVVLTHQNLLANVNQFGARIDLSSTDRVLACLPLFHSFGCTVTLWYPMIEGVTMVTYPNPLDANTLAELIYKHHANLILATPTFLRGYLRKATPKQFESAKLVVTGAEKLPLKIAETFEKKLGKPVLEGYGLTETSPVSNVNLPDPVPDREDGLPVLPNRRLGSVGQPIPGVAVRITDPNTDRPMSLHESGMIWLRGPNIFGGYLNQPAKTDEVIKDGWFRTGDIGRMDEDGFLYIEGRLSRFSKIGGEMVPHETVEDEIGKVLGLDSESERKLAVVGVPDESKGEALILISSVGVDLTELRYRLLQNGVSNLWVPKKVVEVEEIPTLASGKLDIKSCESIAREEV